MFFITKWNLFILFLDGNGRMGRLWQTLILMKEYPIFEFLPFETLISKNQNEYYNALSISDKEGKSTKFIVYMLKIIESSLEDLLKNSTKPLTKEDRIQLFLENHTDEFSRKDYIAVRLDSLYDASKVQFSFKNEWRF